MASALSELMDDDRPFFSIVIPAYNAARFLADALRSVETQSFGRFECIVVDDGSTDQTLEVVGSFAHDLRFRAVRSDHSGLPAHARNVGIREARGLYVAFLDADDVWSTDKLLAFHHDIERGGAAVLFSDALAVGEDTRPTRRLLGPSITRGLRLRDPLLLVRNLVPMSSVVVRREVLLETPFREDPRIRGAEDFRLWLELNAKHAFHYIPEPLLLYRLHAGQISQGDCFAPLDKATICLSGPTIAAAYGDRSVQLALDLISIRKAYAKRDAAMTVRLCARILRRVATPERATILEYLATLGLLDRARAKIRQVRAKRAGPSTA